MQEQHNMTEDATVGDIDTRFGIPTPETFEEVSIAVYDEDGEAFMKRRGCKFVEYEGMTVLDIGDDRVQVWSTNPNIFMDHRVHGVANTMVFNVGEWYVGIYNSGLSLVEEIRGHHNIVIRRQRYMDVYPGITYDELGDVTLISSDMIVSNIPTRLWRVAYGKNKICDESQRLIRIRLFEELTHRAYQQVCVTHLRDEVKITACRESGSPSSYIYNYNKALWVPSTSEDVKFSVIGPLMEEMILDDMKYLRDKITQSNDPNFKIKWENQLSQLTKGYLKIGSSKYVNEMYKGLATAEGAYDPEFKDILDNKYTYLFPTRGGTVVDLRNGKTFSRLEQHYFTFETKARMPLRTEVELEHLREHGYLNNKVFKFFNEVACEDEEMRVELQKWLGYCLSGDMLGRVFTIWYGDGSNGKGTTTSLLKAIVDNFYVEGDKDVFIQNKNRASVGSHTSYLMNLKGRRVTSYPETEEGERLNEALIKKISGGDDLSGRQIGQASESKIKLNLKLYIQTNHLPSFNDSKSMRNRIIPLGFFANFCDNPQVKGDYKSDPHLVKDLIDNHLDEVLEYMVYGAIKYYSISGDTKFFIPSRTKISFEDAMEQNKEEDNDVYAFLKEDYILDETKGGDPEYRVPRSSIVEAYNFSRGVTMSATMVGKHITKSCKFIRPPSNGTYYICIKRKTTGSQPSEL